MRVCAYGGSVLYSYMIRVTKPVEIVLRREERERGRTMGGGAVI
jgi:hypothetical protein